MAQTGLTISIDTFDPQAVIHVVEEKVRDWPEDRRERLAEDLNSVWSEPGALLFEFEGGTLVVTIGQPVFDCLKRHGLLPVIS
ncbi:MAG TPA: hypothetical protein DIT40_06020 [Alphaproteobacteria bacterium]|nr:hypothetical protein [Alphaproteobacteria bacterium]